MKYILSLLLILSFATYADFQLPDGFELVEYKSDEERFTLTLKNAENGQVPAQANVGLFYLHGEGIPKNLKKGAEWIKKASKSGTFSPAWSSMGYIYSNGLGVLRDDKEAFKWFEKAAKSDDGYAQYNLGLMYLNGTGAKKDYRQAKHWIRKAFQSNYKGISKDSQEIWNEYKLWKY